MAFKLKSIMQIAAGATLAAGVSAQALAQETVKIGLIVPLTGGQASTGKQIDNAIKLYMQQNGDDRRRQEDRGHRQGRRRGAGQLQAPRAGIDRQRQGELPRRLRRDAGRARGRAARDAGQGAAGHHGRGHLDHHRTLALHRAHLVHAGAVVRDHRRLGGQERHQEGRGAGLRLRAGRRRAELLQAEIHRRRRRGRRGGQGAARQSGLRAVPAAHEGRQAGRDLRVRAGRTGRQLHEAVCRARARRDQGDRARAT